MALILLLIIDFNFSLTCCSMKSVLHFFLYPVCFVSTTYLVFHSVGFLSWKHKHLCKLVFFSSSFCFFSFQLFDSISIPHCVQSVLRAAGPRTYVGNHDCSAVSSKRPFENLSQFRSSKRCMLLLHIYCSNALFQSQQTFIDFSTIYPCLLICIYHICSSFRSSQVNKAHRSKHLIASFELKRNCKNRMRSGRIHIGSSLASCSFFQSKLQHIKQLLFIIHSSLCKPLNANSLLVVLSTMQKLSVVQQVKKLGAVNLIKTHTSLKLIVVFMLKQ